MILPIIFFTQTNRFCCTRAWPTMGAAWPAVPRAEVGNYQRAVTNSCWARYRISHFTWYVNLAGISFEGLAVGRKTDACQGNGGDANGELYPFDARSQCL